MPDEFEGPDDSENLEIPPSFFPYEGDTPDRRPGSMGELIEVQIEGVFAAESTNSTSRFVLLTDGERKLPIIIGPFEAQAIVLPLEGQRPDRPMTHDLIRNLMTRFDVMLEKVLIDDMWNGVYYAKLILKHGKEQIEMDVRPSDALAIAVRFEAPIYVSDGILDSAME